MVGQIGEETPKETPVSQFIVEDCDIPAAILRYQFHRAGSPRPERRGLTIEVDTFRPARIKKIISDIDFSLKYQHRKDLQYVESYKICKYCQLQENNYYKKCLRHKTFYDDMPTFGLFSNYSSVLEVYETPGILMPHWKAWALFGRSSWEVVIDFTSLNNPLIIVTRPNGVVFTTRPTTPRGSFAVVLERFRKLLEFLLNPTDVGWVEYIAWRRDP